MSTRQEIADLIRDLPTDETWLPMFLERLKEWDPVIYEHMMKRAAARLEEKKS
jgi:hypothetical protein